MAVAEDIGIVRSLAQEFARRLDSQGIQVWRMYLYGSYAKGLAHKDSDIDIAVFLDKDEIEGFPEEVELMSHRRDLDLRIEPHAFSKSDFDESNPYIREIVTTGMRII